MNWAAVLAGVGSAFEDKKRNLLVMLSGNPVQGDLPEQ